MNAQCIRVLLADDHKIVREGLRALLQGEEDLMIIGEAQTGEEAVRLSQELQPDLVLMDIGMRGLNGIEATRQVLRVCQKTRVVVLSMYDDPATIDGAMRAGARGYVVKGGGIDSLVSAIKQVHRGQVHRGHDAVPGPVLSPLSPREREVLELIAEGLSGPQIARRLGLQAKTVENHRARIMEKLDIHTTAGLVRHALLGGLSG